MADFIELAFIALIVAIVFGFRLTPKLAAFLARQHHRLSRSSDDSPTDSKQ
jgi:Sec-independent protein translocase protein TatA